MVEGIEVSAHLATGPRIISSDEGFRVVFEIRSGSRLWKDWAVALVGCITSRLGPDSFVGFFDAVAGRMHAASRNLPSD